MEVSLEWGPPDLPISASGGRKRKEVDPRLQKHRRFLNQESRLQPILCRSVWATDIHFIAPPTWPRQGPEARICWGSFFLHYLELLQKANTKPENLIVLVHARFWDGLPLPVQNQLIPDQFWFLLRINHPSFKVLVLSAGEEIYNVNIKRLHKGYFFSLLPPHLFCFYKNLAELIN